MSAWGWLDESATASPRATGGEGGGQAVKPFPLPYIPPTLLLRAGTLSRCQPFILAASLSILFPRAPVRRVARLPVLLSFRRLLLRAFYGSHLW